MGHTLVLVRHGEQRDADQGVDDGELSERGIEQSRLIAQRLAALKFTNVWHSPVNRAADTVRVLRESLPDIDPKPSALLMDCVPSGPSADMPAAYKAFFTPRTDAEIEAGAAQMSDAVTEYLGHGVKGQTDLLVTHNSVIAWLVREVLGAPEWKWLTLSQAHCGLTVLFQKAGRPWTLVTHNDVGHLPPALRTGLTEPHSL
jgi:probable phosphoglycerate mutase